MVQRVAAKRREKMNKQQNESGTELTERTEPSNNRLSSFIGFLLPKDVFTPLFWKSFISVFLVCVLLYVLEFLRFSTFDSEFSYKHLAVVLVSLSEWSFCVSLACSLYGFRRLLPVLCIPFLIIGMDYSNNAMIGKFNLYSSIFFSMFAGSLFLFVDLLSYSFHCRFLSILRAILFSIVFLLPLLLIGNRILSGSGVDSDAMLAIQQTDVNEAYHFFFELNNGILILVWIAASLALFCYIVFFVFSSRGRNSVSDEKKTSVNKAVVYCLLSLLPCIFFGWFGQMYNRGPHLYQTLSFPREYNQSLKQFKTLQETRMKKLHDRLAAELDNGQSGFDGKFVLVIGESLNRNHMGCYGYPKNTTPFQSAARGDDHFFFFNRPFSCHVQTQRVLLQLLTDLNQYNGRSDDLVDSVSIIDIAKVSGYHTAWLSGQEKISVNNSVISVIAEEADKVIFQQGERAFRDHESIQILGDFLAEGRSFVIVHLYGNHYPYFLAYPSDMKTDDPELSPKDKNSMYDRSVFYNDQIMSELFEVIKQNNVDILMYVSDHSEALTDRKLPGHDPRKYTQEMAEIPWWIYVSDEYQAGHPDIVKQLRNATDQVVTNDLAFDLMLRLMGFNNCFVDETLVPGSDSYRIDEKSARTLYGKQGLVFEK